jgi:hypothetical protein
MKNLTLPLSEEKFKRLAVKLKKSTGDTNLSLSQIHELLAQTFGFRNFNALHAAFLSGNKPTEPKQTQKITSVLSGLTPTQIVHLYEVLLLQVCPKPDSFLLLRSKIFLRLCLPSVLAQISESSGTTLLNIRTLLSSLTFENIERLYNHNRKAQRQIAKIEEYLRTLPELEILNGRLSFTSGTKTQHGELLQLIHVAFFDLQELEDNLEHLNFVFFDSRWYEFSSFENGIDGNCPFNLVEPIQNKTFEFARFSWLERRWFTSWFGLRNPTMRSWRKAAQSDTPPEESHPPEQLLVLDFLNYCAKNQPLGLELFEFIREDIPSLANFSKELTDACSSA